MTMTARMTRLAFAVLALSLLAHADDWVKQFTVSAKPELQVTAGDAHVSVSAWDKNQIQVKIHTVGIRIPEKLQVTGDQTGNQVRVELHQSSTICFGFCVNSVNVEIQVPKDSSVDVHTGDGSIEARDLAGDVRLQSGDGKIVGRNLSGKLNADTSDGNMDIDGRFEVLHVRSGDGNVNLRANYGSRMTGDWSLETGDGNVDLQVPADLAADLDVSTGDGHIQSDLPVEVQGATGENTLQGKLNGGGPRLQVNTGDGSVHLRRVEGSL